MNQLQNLLAQIKPGSYWRQSGAWGSTYIYFEKKPEAVSANDPKWWSIGGWTKAVTVNLNIERIVVQTGPNTSFTVSKETVWTKTTKTFFDFWYSLAGK